MGNSVEEMLAKKIVKNGWTLKDIKDLFAVLSQKTIERVVSAMCKQYQLLKNI